MQLKVYSFMKPYWALWVPQSLLGAPDSSCLASSVSQRRQGDKLMTLGDYQGAYNAYTEAPALLGGHISPQIVHR